MAESIAAQIKTLQGMTVSQLRKRWLEVFGEPTKQRHQIHLWKRLAWKIQEQHYGGLSVEAKSKIEKLRQEFENTPPGEWLQGRHKKQQPKPEESMRDSRLPLAGTVLSRSYKGWDLTVKVLEHGFEYQGQVYRSLSAIARKVTGSNWNGYSFFRLTKGGSR